jgi:hypothetical protein
MFRSRTVKRKLTPWSKRVLRGTLQHRQRIEVHEAWIEVALNGEWTVAYRMVRGRRGEPLIGEVRVFPTESRPGRPAGIWSAEVLGSDARVPNGGISAELLRTVRIQDYQPFAPEFSRWSLKRLVDVYKTLPRPSGTLTVTLPVHVTGGTPVSTGPGRPGRPDRFYAEVAEEYVKSLARGKRPVSDIAKRRRISQSQARDMIREARERGLLTPTRRGKQGGELTEHARKILSQS